MEFNKLDCLKLTGNVVENFKLFKEEVIGRVMRVLMYCQYEKTILMTDEKIGYRAFSIYLLIMILTV